jgi:hypothetical protein
MLYRVEVTNHNDMLVETTITAYPYLANKAARSKIKAGYFVTVYNDVTGEVLAGPYSPDSPLPKFVV